MPFRHSATHCAYKRMTNLHLRNKAIHDIYATGAHLSRTRMENAGITVERANEIVEMKFDDADPDYDWTSSTPPEPSVDGPISVNKFLHWCFYNDTYKECISTKKIAYGNWVGKTLPPRGGYIYDLLNRHFGDGDNMIVRYGNWERDVSKILTKDMDSLLQSAKKHWKGVDRIHRHLQTLSCALELAPFYDHKCDGYDAYVKLQREKNYAEQKNFIRRESENEDRTVPKFERLRELTRDKFGENSKESLCIDLFAEARLRKNELQDIRFNPPKDQREKCTYIIVTEDTAKLKRYRGYRTRKLEQYGMRDDCLELSAVLGDKIRSYIGHGNTRLFEKNQCASTFVGNVLTEIKVKTPEWKWHNVRLLGRSYVSTERARAKLHVDVLQQNYLTCEQMDHTAKASSRLINTIHDQHPRDDNNEERSI